MHSLLSDIPVDHKHWDHKYYILDNLHYLSCTIIHIVPSKVIISMYTPTMQKIATCTHKGHKIDYSQNGCLILNNESSEISYLHFNTWSLHTLLITDNCLLIGDYIIVCPHLPTPQSYNKITLRQQTITLYRIMYTNSNRYAYIMYLGTYNFTQAHLFKNIYSGFYYLENNELYSWNGQFMQNLLTLPSQGQVTSLCVDYTKWHLLYTDFANYTYYSGFISKTDILKKILPFDVDSNPTLHAGGYIISINSLEDFHIKIWTPRKTLNYIFLNNDKNMKLLAAYNRQTLVLGSKYKIYQYHTIDYEQLLGGSTLINLITNLMVIKFK